MADHGKPVRRDPGDPQKETEVDIRTIRLPGKCLGEAAKLLACCFHDNPNFVVFFPGEGARSRAPSRVRRRLAGRLGVRTRLRRRAVGNGLLGEPYRYPWGIGALLLDQDGSPILLQQESDER